eukprot:TRINITY_DN550_c0_g1_i1.p1 TRINITY_DN550_c0_g1~~TRINITY_DN550_c0_g1_i1.p1  ORF type:complete len:252 (-),score=63.59 TRINITY_DN550_c0_g1_i1:617-1372(-)
MFGHTTVVEILLKHGADVGQRSPEGTCMEIAEKTNNREIIRLLFDLSGITGANATTSSKLEELEQTITEFYKSLHAENIEKRNKSKPIWNKSSSTSPSSPQNLSTGTAGNTFSSLSSLSSTSRTSLLADKKYKITRSSTQSKSMLMTGPLLVIETGQPISSSASSSNLSVYEGSSKHDTHSGVNSSLSSSPSPASPTHDQNAKTDQTNGIDDDDDGLTLNFEQSKKDVGEEFEELRKLGEGAYGKVFFSDA